MQKFIKFPKIGQFRDVVKQVKDQTHWAGKDENGDPIFDRTRKCPTLTFNGTVKLHGTNAAIVRNKDGSIHFQSREHIITPTSDNAGFALWASTIDWDFFINCYFPKSSEVAIFGEWCGSNIQKGVALNQLSKRFVIFKVMVDGTWFKNSEFCWPEKNIFHISKFPTWSIDIDFENPGNSQSVLTTITEQVESECPFAKYFGVSGIGEGVVWTATENPSLVFKVKGEKHSASKVKTLAAVDPEKASSLTEFIENTVTENRLLQGLENIDEISVKNTGNFIKWVYNDILVEEASSIIASMLEPKEISKEVANKAKAWFFKRIENGNV